MKPTQNFRPYWNSRNLRDFDNHRRFQIDNLKRKKIASVEVKWLRKRRRRLYTWTPVTILPEIVPLRWRNTVILILCSRTRRIRKVRLDLTHICFRDDFYTKICVLRFLLTICHGFRYLLADHYRLIELEVARGLNAIIFRPRFSAS